MALYDIENLLTVESGRIGPDIHQRTLNTSPYMKLIPQDAWPDEMGNQITALTFERALPHDPSTGAYTPNSWTSVTNNPEYDESTDNGLGNCVPSANKVNFPQTTRTYKIYQTALESPDICVNDLRFPVYRKQQLSNCMEILTQNTQYLWTERVRDEYIRVCDNKVVLAPGAATSAPGGSTLTSLGYEKGAAAEGSAQTGWFTTGSTITTEIAAGTPSQLTPNILKRFYMRLIRDGAGNNPLGRENGRPVFGLITDSETHFNLITLDEATRQDIRYSSNVNDLLAPLGVERSYGGFYHMVDDFAPRWDFSSGAWVRRYPYKGVAVTKGGFKMDIDPAYESAAWTDTIIFHQDVMKVLVPKPITSPGGNVSFEPQNYKGEWNWLNIKDRTNNPDGTIGFFRGVFQTASQPVFPQYGIVIRHLRCGGVPVSGLAC